MRKIAGLSDEEEKRKGSKNRSKHTRKRIRQDEKNFFEKFKTVSSMFRYRFASAFVRFQNMFLLAEH